MSDSDYRDTHEPMLLATAYAGTAHWVSTFVGPDRGDGKNRLHVQITDPTTVMDLDYEEVRSLHTWLSYVIARESHRGR